MLIIFLKNIIKNLLFKISLIPAFLILIVIRLLKLRIRFGKVKRDNVGNSTLELFLYLNDKSRHNYKDLFFYDGKNISNTYLNNVISKSLKIFPFSKQLHFLSKKIKIFNSFYLELPNWWNRKSTNFLSTNLKTPKEFIFDKEKNKIGFDFLKKHGYKNNKIVCLLVRDNFFKKTYSNQKKDWSYHNFRNADIFKYKKGIRFLLKKNYFVIRIGRGSEKKVYFKDTNYFDYSNLNIKYDFLDYWIISKCHFCITTGTGIDEACSLYKKPILDTNFFPIGRVRSGQNYCISIFKKILKKKTKRFLNLSQIIELDKKNMSIFKDFHSYKKLNFRKKYVLKDNTPEEILEAIKEIEMRLSKSYKETKKNIRNQKKFWNIFKKSGFFKNHVKKVDPKSRISKKFIDNNQWIIK